MHQQVNMKQITPQQSPTAGRAQGSLKRLFARYAFAVTAALALALTPTAPAADPTFTVIQNFDYYTTGGYPIFGKLIQGTDGALYGTTSYGGSSYYGTVFKLNPDGSGFTVLQNLDFYTTGGHPYGGLVQGTDGALYGTTSYGGSSDYGTVFKVNPDGSGFTVIQNLDYDTTGAYPYGGLLRGTDGALYGTTTEGGSSGAGTVFKLNPDGSGLTVLQNFDYDTTGAYSIGGLVQGTDGALYGTTTSGGSSGVGTVFKLNPDGSGFTVLQNFDYYTTGAYSYGGLLQGADGALYGTTTEGGSSYYGTVFKLNPDGSGFIVLQNLDFYTTGAYSQGGLAQGTDGALYGTTSSGGSSYYGTVFKVNPDGSGFTVLQNLDYSTTGGASYSGLVRGTDGALYGMTYYGGSSWAGTVFRLGLASTPVDTVPPVLTLPGSIVAEATGSSGATVTFSASASDAVDGTVAVTLSPASGSTFPLGTTTVNATARDAAGNIAIGSFTVTVRDTTAPVLSLPASGTVEATGPGGASVTYTGSASDLVSGAVTVNFSPASGSTFPLGTTTVTATATDAAGNIASESFTVTVRDTTAPVITSLGASPAVLWPPNHKMVTVSVAASATDAVSSVTGRILSVTSNEPDNGLGDGDTAGDIVITGAGTVSLRAERASQGNGRIYTIVFEASDNSGNKSTKTVTVSVPKSQGK